MALTFFEKKILFLAIAIATFMIILDYSIANVSIPYIAGDLSVSVDQGTYVITSFAAGNAIGLAMTGWLTKRIGDVRLFLIAIVLFTLFSWICGLSFNISMLVISRFIQGLVAGPVIPLSQSLIIMQGSVESRSRDLSIWTTIVITAPVVGPILGGYISDWYHWSWIFFMNIPIGVFATLVVWILIGDTSSKREKAPGDFLGILLLSLGVISLQILLDKGQQWDWFRSHVIEILSAVALLSFTYLIFLELWHKTPFLELKIFRIPSFTLSILALIVSYAIYFGTIVTVPLWLQEYMGYDAEWAGFTVAFLGVAPLLVSGFIPKIIKTWGNLNALIVGFCLFALGCFYTSFFTTSVDWRHIAFSRFIFGLGLAIYFNPLLAMSVQDVPQEKLPSATSIFHFVRALVGGIGTSLFTTLWIRRSYYHHERVGEAVTLFNPITPPVHSKKGLTILNNLLDVEASLLAINDVFYLMAWLFIALIILLLIYKIFQKKHLF